MRDAAIIDTGPLVAFLSERDDAHAWTLAQMTDMAYSLLTCEAVLSEACFLLNRRHASQLMRKYANVPMSFADACLVRMAELYDDSAILTLDSDFHIYRKHGRQPLETIMPVE